MFARLFRSRPSNRAIVDALYGEIVAAARQPALYEAWDVPDTPLGRYEMVGLHVFLVLRRLRGRDEAARGVAQEIVDEFFRDLEHSIRELGIGDLGVPKRMKRLSRMFYGRVAAYGEALDADDHDALARALTRNVRPDCETWPGAVRLAAYVASAAADLDALPLAGIMTGRIGFPVAGSSGQRSA